MRRPTPKRSRISTALIVVSRELPHHEVPAEKSGTGTAEFPKKSAVVPPDGLPPARRVSASTADRARLAAMAGLVVERQGEGQTPRAPRSCG
jgi:hypothetical protein